MAEYINRNTLLEALCGNDASRMEDYYYNAIKDFPATDVAPVVHGRWVNIPLKMDPEYFAYKYNLRKKCTICEYAMPAEYPDFYICPHCGAKMDLEV